MMTDTIPKVKPSKIEVTQADRDAAADAVKAYRDNKNGNWQARIRNGECDDGYIVQAFASHRLATRTDATPVARKQFPILGSRGAKIDLQLVEDHGKQAYSNHYQTVERLAERGGLSWCELHAVLNNRPWQKLDENTAIAECRAIEARYLGAFNPPATDVAALVEAAQETNAALERDGDPAFAHLILANKAAIAPFTKGQNDE